MQQIKQNKINYEITASQVRLLSQNGEQLGIVSTKEALNRANELGLDLVEINPQSSPVVCKIMDYGKYIYEKNKSIRIQKKKQKPIQLKEIRMRPVTDVADYKLKIKRIIGFLEHNDKVKVSITFRGRELMHQQLGKNLLEMIKSDLKEYGNIESQSAGLENRQFHIIVSPKKNKTAY